MKINTAALLIATLGLLGTVFAQDNVVISPQSIVVNPSPSFDVQVFVDKDTSGDAAPVYNIGESIRVGVSVSEDAYVYLFSVHSDGTIEQILPNGLADGSNNFVSGGSTRYFPPRDARYTFDVAGPQGLGQSHRGRQQKPAGPEYPKRFFSGGRLLGERTGRGLVRANLVHRGESHRARRLGHGHGHLLCGHASQRPGLRHHQHHV